MASHRMRLSSTSSASSTDSTESTSTTASVLSASTRGTTGANLEEALSASPSADSSQHGHWGRQHPGLFSGLASERREEVAHERVRRRGGSRRHRRPPTRTETGEDRSFTMRKPGGESEMRGFFGKGLKKGAKKG
ncbi:hypothetical protein FQN53_009772 [Emmonsiellopsis sp. PD_33]|nr:hypothetical protein FQN53_009772 [Emmonsiellopsis sp. PD_33]